MSAYNIDVLREFGERFLGPSGASMAMLLGQDRVDVSCVDAKAASWAEFKMTLPAFVAIVQTGFEQSIKGPVLIIVKPHDVAVFASMVMGGDGKSGVATELSDMEFHAFGEVMGQVLAASATSATQLLGKKLGLTAPQVSQVDLNQFALPAEYAAQGVVFTYSLVVGDILNTEFYCLITENEAQALQNSLSPAEEKKEEVMGESSSATEQQEPSLADLLGAVEGSSTPSETTASAPAKQKEVSVQPVQFSSFEAGGGASAPTAMPANIELVLDVPLQVTVELGRAKKTVKEILELSTGSIVELDKMDGEPVDILANGKLFAKGEVVVIGETFGVRVVEIVSPQERLSRVRD